MHLETFLVRPIRKLSDFLGLDGVQMGRVTIRLTTDSTTKSGRQRARIRAPVMATKTKGELSFMKVRPAKGALISPLRKHSHLQ